ncbi:hypothetical protein BJX99DRAFT_265755 [Aspergillus californicus]
MSIGASFDSEEIGVTRTTAKQWVTTVSTSLNTSHEKMCLDLDGIRVHCLLLLARQTTAVDADTVCLSSGAVVRRAMHMGLHIDPIHHPAYSTMSPVEVESRRRLWATVLELDIQSSMDCGNFPLIDIEYYNCRLPSNVHDGGQPESTSPIPSPSMSPKPMDTFTPCSIQILLIITIPVRTKRLPTAKPLPHSPSPQRRALRHAENLLCLSRCIPHEQIAAFTIPDKLYNLSIHRFFLALHNPFALRAMTDPTFYFSRKLCLETSLALFQDRAHSESDDVYRLRLLGSAIFHDAYIQSAIHLCSELRTQYIEAGPFSTSSGNIIERNTILSALT